MRRILKLLAVVAASLVLAAVVLAAQIFGPPLFSGGLSLLVSGPQTASPPDPVTPYEPVHQGHVNLANGVYIREDEDIVLGKGPAFVWRRTYLFSQAIASAGSSAWARPTTRLWACRDQLLADGHPRTVGGPCTICTRSVWAADRSLHRIRPSRAGV